MAPAEQDTDDQSVDIDWRDTAWPEGWTVREGRDGWISVGIPPETYPGGQMAPRMPPKRGYHRRGVSA